MGEYASYRGDRVKIGTCEDLYYLRFPQRHLVTALPGNVDPNSDDVYGLRFRFAWPDEDSLEPGDDGPGHNYERSIRVPDMMPPEGVEHYSVQFSAHAGYLVSLPCPESMPDVTPGLNTKGPHGLKIARNGFGGSVQLVQQKLLRDGRLVPVLKCGGCGARWRVEKSSEIEAIALAFRKQADEEERRKGSPKFYHAIADRILEGAKVAAEVEV
jgi:hypothetical protein